MNPRRTTGAERRRRQIAEASLRAQRASLDVQRTEQSRREIEAAHDQFAELLGTMGSTEPGEGSEGRKQAGRKKLKHPTAEEVRNDRAARISTNRPYGDEVLARAWKVSKSTIQRRRTEGF
jgi:hypothetical protein